MNATPSNYAVGRLKRTTEIVVASGMLIISSPLIAIAMVAIRTETAGNALFGQTRVGRKQRQFRCYKLRTMHVGTASVATHEAPVSAVTSVGRFLRRTKIDELPQLWNVLRGEMSLVGPRPCLPSQIELIGCREKLGVFAVRPGVTGLAQVAGVDMSEPARLAEIDAQYARSASFGGDLRLLLATIFLR